MFGKLMSISDDADVEVLHAADRPDAGGDRRAAACVRLGRDDRVRPAVRVGRRIVADYHGPAAAEGAEQAVRARHAARQGHGDELPVRTVQAGQLLRKVLVELGMADSGSDATRKIAQGGVRIDGVVASDIGVVLESGIWTIQAGKKQIARVHAR